MRVAETLSDLIGRISTGVRDLEVCVPGLVLRDEVVQRDFACIEARRDRCINASAGVPVQTEEVVVEFVPLQE